MSTARLELTEDVRRAITAHAESCAPNECCGLLASDSDDRVRFVYPMTNSRSSPTSYTIDPDEHYAAFRHAESMGWSLSGVFHSHPTGTAIPSKEDVLKALDPEWLYLISDLNQLRGYRIRDGQVTEVDLR